MDKAPIHMLYGEEDRGSSDFMLHCETISSRSSQHRFEIALHRHKAFLQMVYIEQGTGDALFAEETVRLGAGSLVTLPPMGSHGFRFSPDIEGLVLTLDMAATACRDVLAGPLSGWYDRPRHQIISQCEDADHLRHSLSRIAREFESRQPGRAELLESLSLAALVLAARIGMSSGEGADFARFSGDRRFARFFDLVDRHFREHRPASFYAKEADLSVTHLNRLLRQSMDLSIHEILLRRLIDQACRDLVFTQIPVQNISLELGFADAAYFSRLFQKRTGRTPRQYRLEERRKRAY